LKVNKMKSIERLRASRQTTLQDDFAAGKLEGRSWAAKVATYRELVRTSRFCSTVEKYRSTDQVSTQALDLRDQVALATIKKNGLADDTDSITAFFGGFMEGASEFFEEVKGQI
jgi:hypothetical protein